MHTHLCVFTGTSGLHGFAAVLAAAAVMFDTATCVDHSVAFAQRPASGVISALSPAERILPAESKAECALSCTLINTCLSFEFHDAVSGCRVCRSGDTCGGLQMTAAKPAPIPLPTPATLGSQVTLSDNRTFQVIQQRINGAVEFAKYWTDYEEGFGDDSNFWIGLKRIHNLTQPSGTTLRVELQLFNEMRYVCEYSKFTVASASTNYTMSYNSFLYSASNFSFDSLSMNRGMAFSTMGVDNDRLSGGSCTLSFGKAGWWFNSCSGSNPNGQYPRSASDAQFSFSVWTISSGAQALKEVRLMLQTG